MMLEDSFERIDEAKVTNASNEYFVSVFTSEDQHSQSSPSERQYRHIYIRTKIRRLFNGFKQKLFQEPDNIHTTVLKLL